MSKSLPLRPNLEHLKQQAKDLLAAVRAQDSDALGRIAALFPSRAEFRLTDAQLVIAREYGFESWPRLKHHIEVTLSEDGLQATAERIVRELVESPSSETLAYLAKNPDIAEFSPALALAMGRHDLVTNLDPNKKIGPLDREPLLYVSFSALLGVAEVVPALTTTAASLIAAGANPNAAYIWEGDGRSPLSALYGASGRLGNVAMTKLLLEKGANPNDGESLYHAAELSDPTIYRLLLEHGASIHQMNALARLLDYEKPEWLQMLLEFVPNRREIPPVIPHAIRRGRSDETIGILIDSGMDLDAPDLGAITPVQAAIRHGRAGLANRMIAAGAKDVATDLDRLVGQLESGGPVTPAPKAVLKTLDTERSPVLVQWAEQGKVEPIRRALRLGLDPNAVDENGVSGLQMAAANGNLTLVDMFLKAKVDPWRRDPVHNGNALGWACYGSQFMRHAPDEDYAEIVRRFIALGDVPEEKHYGSPAVLTILRQRGIAE